MSFSDNRISATTTTTCTVASPVRRAYNELPQTMTMTMPLTGLSPPSKGFFAPSSMPNSRTDASSNGAISSAVPSRGRRRESITGQMRRKATDTASAAGAGGASGLSMSRAAAGGPGSPNGRPIPMMARSPRMGAVELGGLSTSFGAAAEALTLSSSLASNSTVAPGSFQARSNAQPIKNEGRSQGHSHLGVECFGPSSLDSSMPMPSPGMITSHSSAGGALDNGNKRDRRTSVSSTGTVGDDDDDKAGKHEQLHRCESCAKVYRHPSCLIKHRWEHTVYWKEASKFLMSKHQQVQLLEAAAILVGMDANARSLPEEKALWPAAVSPPSSGLLGSESINFETLMASKRRNTVSSNASGSPARGPTPSLVLNDSSDGSTTSTYDPSMRSATMSPLAGLGNMRLTENDAKHPRYRLDDSASGSGSGSDRADRSGSADMYDDEDVEEEDRLDQGQERYGADAGGDVMANMEMDDVN
ncbi:potential zinc finger protein [Pseudozyma hubeiensis SY62]|uniref:Potential zinc finger protein n=1 Tax=Pseudozyma hubeiensis (strain SY62) TaxID=1305764 RepID=R9NZL7_PSEHS|nr:potential zinc finger protein [Pseudozyma hubeiensis SY62]GAC94236.1 potential zinc finger protein [Pseudozyma hubeiensis SY62]